MAEKPDREDQASNGEREAESSAISGRPVQASDGEGSTEFYTICELCFRSLQDPALCPHGRYEKLHYSCRGCITSRLHGSATCPVCSRNLTANDLKPAELLSTDECEQREKKCDSCGEKLDCYTLKKEIDELETSLARLKDELNSVKPSCHNALRQFQERKEIMVLGGCDGKFRLNSVEFYSWEEGEWMKAALMKQRRSGASSFLYKQQLFVAGGKHGSGSHDDVETISRNDSRVEWSTSQIKLRRKSWGHTTVVYQDRLIVCGGYDGAKVSREIYEIRLTPDHDHTAKWLFDMPRPLWNHCTQLIGNKMVIFGGMTSTDNKDSIPNVLVYDIAANEVHEMPPLPKAVNGAAGVVLGNSVILLGGADKDERRLRTVIKYDVSTGQHEKFPPMKYRRDGCAAVLTGNAIVVVGGYDHNSTTNDHTYLNSAEYLDLNSYKWKELPPMNNRRSYPVAVVKPSV